MIYDMKKQHEKWLEFFAECDTNKGNVKHKIMHEARSANLDKLVYECFKQCLSEDVPISGPILMEKA